MSAALVAMSCAKELTDNQEAAGNDNVVYKTITFESLATKTTLDETTGAVAWEEGDQFSIYYINAEGKAAEAVATTQSAGASAVFTAQIPEADTPTEYYAAYPKGFGRLTINETTDEATQEVTKTVSFAVYIAPHKCDGTFKSANYAVAYTVASDDMALAFKNAVGLVKVTLPEGGVFKHDGKDYKVSGVYLRGINGADTNIGNMPVVIEDNAITGFGTPDGVKNIPIENLSKAAIEAGYAYLPTAPCNWTNGICVRYLSADATIPAVLSKEKSISVERGHVLPLPDVSSMVVFDYYVSTDGEGDGTSSDKPMNITKMQEMFTAGGATMAACYKLDGTTFHLADGDYVLSETFTIPKSANKTVYSVKIKGNPTDASKAILNGNSTVGVLALNDYIHLTLENLAIKNGSASAGAGIKMALSAETTDKSFVLDCKNCIFTGNVATGSGGGALFVNDDAKGGMARFHECYFVGNKATKADTGQGGVLYTAVSQTAFFFNKCYFETSTAVQNASYIYMNDKTNYANRLGMNNCTINTGDTNIKNGAAVTNVGYTVIVNSTLWAKNYCGKRGLIALGRGIKTGDKEGSKVINCFLKNNPYKTTYDYKAFWNHSDYYQHIDHCIYSGIFENGATSTGDNPTYTLKDSYDYASIGDVIGKANPNINVNGVTLKTYSWNWIYPSSHANAGQPVYPGFVCPTYQQVRDAISSTNGVGATFLAWLDEVEADNAALKTDMHGRARDITAMCPGSYQQEGTPSGN